MEHHYYYLHPGTSGKSSRPNGSGGEDFPDVPASSLLTSYCRCPLYHTGTALSPRFTRLHDGGMTFGRNHFRFRSATSIDFDHGVS